jgi:hypothetical protein
VPVGAGRCQEKCCVAGEVGGTDRQLVALIAAGASLITQRSQVQILPPLQTKTLKNKGFLRPWLHRVAAAVQSVSRNGSGTGGRGSPSVGQRLAASGAERQRPTAIRIISTPEVLACQPDPAEPAQGGPGRPSGADVTGR